MKKTIFVALVMASSLSTFANACYPPSKPSCIAFMGTSTETEQERNSCLSRVASYTEEVARYAECVGDSQEDMERDVDNKLRELESKIRDIQRQ